MYGVVTADVNVKLSALSVVVSTGQYSIETSEASIVHFV